jgi:hypothetical protein
MRRSAATRPLCWSEITSWVVQAAFLQGAQEAAPKHLIFGITDIDAQDFPAAGGGDSGGDHDGHAGHLPAGASAADMQVGGVEEQVGKGGVVQRPAAERRHGLVQPCADPRHLRLRDAGVDAERGHQVVDGAGGDAVDIGLHHYRIQGLVDPAPRLQDHREERALPQLRDPQLHIPGLGRKQPGSGPVAVGDTRFGALIAVGADPLTRLCFDQLLHHQPHRLADQVHALPGTKRLQQLGCDRLGQRHR